MHGSDYGVLALFAIIFLNIFGTGIVLKRRGLDYKGAAPIRPAVYRLGKLASFLVWALFVLAAAYPQALDLLPGRLMDATAPMRWAALALAFFATVLILMSFRSLGRDLKFGLPEKAREASGLRTTGLYAFSRNPMYLAFAVLNVAAVLYVPHIATVVLALTATGVHHLIILSEERFLAARWKERYHRYARRVRRYI